jgi:phospholipase/lecithinase/hemolysin
MITFDFYTLFQSILENPAAYPETARYLETSTYCDAYVILFYTNVLTGPLDWNLDLPSCQYPVDEYFWFNNLHPTYPLHNVTAGYIADALG